MGNQNMTESNQLVQLRDLEALFANENGIIFGQEELGDKVRIEKQQGEVQVRFPLPHFGPEIADQILRMGHRYFSQIRVRSWKSEDYRFYAWMDEDREPLEDRFFFSFQGMLGYYNLLARKKEALTVDEANFLLDSYRFVYGQKREIKPEELLQELGVMLYRSDGTVTWDSLAGYEQVKREVMESVILPLQHPDIYAGVAKASRGNGVPAKNMPRAILFSGPPGVGKTTMARMIAHEVGLPLLYIPIESIISKYYGESSKNLVQILDIAGRMGKVVLFLDEIDSLAGSRSNNMFEATRRVLSVLLRYLDGFETKGEILTLGATNRPEDLDNALLSRFDHNVHFPLPNEKERKAILHSYARNLSEDELERLAQQAQGLSGRSLKDMCEYAERWWARHIILQKREVSHPPLEAYLKALAARSPES
jgi:hypothetical protein